MPNVVRLSLALLVFAASSARADSMPSCEPGTHMVANPTPPGSMHHGGAHCEPDVPPAPVAPPPVAPPPAAPAATPPTAPAASSSCNVSHHGASGATLLALAALALLGRRLFSR